MFVEPQIVNKKSGNIGWIEAICGCMFSGKTEELIRRMNRALIAHQQVEIFIGEKDIYEALCRSCFYAKNNFK